MLDRDPYVGSDPFGMFPLFLEKSVVLAPVSVKCFGGLFIWVVSQLAGDGPMLPLFQKVHHHPLANCQPIYIT